MRLVDNWRKLHLMWSVRLMALQAVIDGAYAGWPAFQDTVSPAVFMVVAVSLSMAALAARLVHQPEVH